MNKKFLSRIFIIIFVIVFIGLLSIVIKTIIHNNELSKLTKYSIKQNENIIREFDYKDMNYVLTSYYDSNFSYAFNNILIKDKDNYYIIEKIEQCDMSNYMKDNQLYVHCIGKKGDIIKYTIEGTNVKKEIINFDYSNTPNISQIHITVDYVDDKYIYLESAVKNDYSIEYGEYVKCSLSSEKCEYYNKRD